MTDDPQRSDQDGMQIHFAIASLSWKETQPGPRGLYGTPYVQYLVQWSSLVNVDPVNGRKQLHRDVFGWARQHYGAPDTAAVELISVEPDALPQMIGADGLPVSQDFYCAVTVKWVDNHVSYTRTWDDVVPVEPGTSREELVTRLAERARTACWAPADAVVVALTVLPNALPVERESLPA
ncbi:hypothetical protein ACIRPK_20405 [Kitasatospora sp. NPDC101801]|uniref:hypothetical protein n=1 Tax=Kitasatospora sp. NPDC101801 TaxID=3364103 RepID=UPI00380176FA